LKKKTLKDVIKNYLILDIDRREKINTQKVTTLIDGQNFYKPT
jgi:hypothetical protein